MNAKTNTDSKEASDKLSELAKLVKGKYSRDILDKGKIPQETDLHFYTRYLAKQWNVNKAFKQIVEMLDWRQRTNVDAIGQLSADEVLCGNEGIEYKVLQCFPIFGLQRSEGAADVRTNDPNSGIIRDSHGRLVFCYKVGALNVDALLGHVDEEVFMKYTIWRFERMVELLGETVESKTEADKWILLFDLEGFSMSKHAKRKVINVIKEFNSLGASCYRETVSKIVIINAPKPFSFAWSMVRPFVNSQTRKKIIIASGKGDEKVSEYEEISKQLSSSEKNEEVK
jgi:hypothetical protein